MDAYHRSLEHPRPDFERGCFSSLDGTWEFSFDDMDEGLRGGWERPGFSLGGNITVPFAYQAAKSGIGTDEIHPILWYRRAFIVPEGMRGRRVWLRFGAVDFRCRVWVNGRACGEHEGGYAPFGFDVTPFLQEGTNDLCLRVEDWPDREQPRGKQYWERGLMGCWYTPVSGIWQTVYLEATGNSCLELAHVTPLVGSNAARVDVQLAEAPASPLRLTLKASLDGREVCETTIDITHLRSSVTLDLRGPGGVAPSLWSPENPALYGLSMTLSREGETLDEVRTWFGMRSVEVKEGHVLLNGVPVYQRLVLNQGYWPDTLMTPPDGEALLRDVLLMKELGFNGVRMHQKMEDPRFYHLCDRLGLLVWAELPSAYTFGRDMLGHAAKAMLDFIRRDYNHPSIVAWVPLNESWGVGDILDDPAQQAASRMLTQCCRAMDRTRIVSANDGWEQTETDICALHDYTKDGEALRARFADRKAIERDGCCWKKAYARGVVPTGDEALLITEYGGIAMKTQGAQGEMGGMETWGYHDKAEGEEEFLKRFEDVTDGVRAIPYCRGFCYTQLTDVMQEINGLLTPERLPKADPARMRDIVLGMEALPVLTVQLGQDPIDAAAAPAV
ncbi:MAG TPA: glycoside hydrolase family 2 TIM barrel-domain containing protein [Candidatus Limnocylindria bacterium]|nr:glycoside hydrolase family 2 TIM barrel-domain containing protein [Candidatus Limnocylindria bacterium]